MNDGFQFLDIILFAAIAAFFVIRLRSVLGKRTGHEKKPDRDRSRRRDEEETGEDTVIQLPDREAQDDASVKDVHFEDLPSGATGKDAEVGDTSAGLTRIKLADRNFNEDEFVGGARAAFEMIISAFAQNDTATLRPLLSNDVFDNFDGAIKEREGLSHDLETTLIGITEAEIIECELQQKTAFITVKFVSEQINVTRDSDGNIVEGDPSHVAKITDIWTFARNTRSRDPNWALVATRSPN